jgi:hypothetical protein
MLWSWILAVIGVAGIYFVGKKTIWGWLVLLFNETLWIAYAVLTQQYGFIFSAIAYAIVYIKSYIHWTNDKKVMIKNLEDTIEDMEFFRE